jgi:hypothetical protein
MPSLPQIVDEMIEGEPFVPAAVAQRLLEEHPETVEMWLREHRLAILSEFVRGRAASRRMSARSQAKAIAAGRMLAGGSVAELRSLLDMHYDVEGQQIPLARMGHEALLTASDGYRDRGNSALFEAAFLSAIARKVTGAKVVEDVYDDEALAKMRSRIGESLEGAA